MIGRPRKERTPIIRPLKIFVDNKEYTITKRFILRCPVCGSQKVREDGTQIRRNTRIQGYRCDNEDCPFLITHKGPKQFTITSSYAFKHIMEEKIGSIITKIAMRTCTLNEIARDYNISSGLVTYLKNKYISALDKLHSLEDLVLDKQIDTAISIDETFLKIKGKTFYILMATGYQTHRVLALHVSQSRKEEDMRRLFDEAQKNTKNAIEIVTADAWGATQTMVKNLNRPMKMIIHKHKKPYDKAVLFDISYTNTTRKITTIGVKTDFYKKRAKRALFYQIETQTLNVPPKKTRGRPKGMKNGQGKKKQHTKTKKKRGRKGLHTVFDKGKRAYVKVDPYRQAIRVSKSLPPAVTAALEDAFILYNQKYIQNNLAEHKNSVLSSHLVLSGPKTVESVEKNLRAFFFIQNHPDFAFSVDVSHGFHRRFMLEVIKRSNLLILFE